jgi:hypothetical protein
MKLSRKKQANPEKWTRNVRKSLHLQEKEYISQTGKRVPPKQVRPVDCTKCKYKCNDRISAENRVELFNTFYLLADYERQKDFICANIRQKKTRIILNRPNKAVQNKRNVSRIYTFVVAGTVQQVCKRFFKATLCVGET